MNLDTLPDSEAESQIQDQANIVQFEHDFYSAYKDLEHTDLLREIWNWDDEHERIRLRIPYDKLRIYKWLGPENKCFCYVVGTDLPTGFSQVEYFGFRIPEQKQPAAEALSLFISPDFPYSTTKLNQQFIQQVCLKKERERGIEVIYATCALRLLPLYIRWGWRLRDTRIINNQVRYFISCDL